MGMTLSELYMARVQQMAKWIAGHAVEVYTVDIDHIAVLVLNGEEFVTDTLGFPSELDIAKCALAISAEGGDYSVADMDSAALYQFMPPREANEGARWGVKRVSRSVAGRFA